MGRSPTRFSIVLTHWVCEGVTVSPGGMAPRILCGWNCRKEAADSPPVADKNERRPVEWGAVFLAVNHCQLRVTHGCGR